MLLHKNSPKRFYIAQTIYYIVTKTHDNFPYFNEPIFCELFIEELKLCKQLKQFKLYAFSIMPDHINILLKPEGRYNFSNIMQFIKRHTTRNANDIMNPFHNVGGIGQCRLHYGEEIVNPIKKINNKIISLKGQFNKKFPNTQNIFPPFKWQSCFYDHVIRNERDFNGHYNYTINNHLKHQLPEDWHWTSSNFPELIDEVVFCVGESF